MSPQTRFWVEALLAGAFIVGSAPLMFVVTRHANEHPIWWYLGYMAFVSVVILFVLDRRPGDS